MAPLSLRMIFAPYSPEMLDKIVSVPNWTPPLRLLPSLSLAPLAKPFMCMSLPAVGAATWINTSTIVLIITITLGIILARQYCRKSHRLPRFGRKKIPSAPLELQTQATTPKEDTPTLKLPLYPDLNSEIKQ